MKTALILIDIQNDYCPGGKGELENPLEAALQARRLLDFFRQQKWPTVHIQHVATRPGAVTFLPDTDGVKIHASILPLAGETVIVKHFPNSFAGTMGELMSAVQENRPCSLAATDNIKTLDIIFRAYQDAGW